MKIYVKWEVSYTSGSMKFDLEDVNCESVEEWEALSESEKSERLQEAIDNIPESPAMLLDSYEEID